MQEEYLGTCATRAARSFDNIFSKEQSSKFLLVIFQHNIWQQRILLRFLNFFLYATYLTFYRIEFLRQRSYAENATLRWNLA